VDKISFLTKFRRRKNICINKISVKKKYRHRKNIGFNKISLPANIGEEKISTMQKYPFRQNIVGGRKFVYCILKIKFITVITAKNKELLLKIVCGPFSACFW
jgi:hypothetical protein